MSKLGHEGPAVGDPRKAGLLRISLAAAVLLVLLTLLPPATPAAYLAVALALAFGGLLAAGRPARLTREPLARVVVDALIVGLLTAGTGGAESPFFPLYLPAALGIVRVRGVAGIVAAMCVVLAAFLGSAAVSGGVEALLSTPAGLGAAFVVLFCAVAGVLGSEIGALARRRSDLSASLAAGRSRVAKVEGLVAGFGPALRNSSAEEILRWTVGAAHAAGGGTYAHVAALEGNHHQTMMEGDPDVCPSWWHPSIQRLVLRSCRDDDTARSEEDVHGIEGFLAVPVGPAEGDRWGAVVVGGGEFGADEEHALGLVSSAATAALEGVEDAPGGRDPASGLPNRDSLRRVLRRELARGRPLTVLAADTGGAPGRDLPRRIADRLGHQRAFRYGEETFVLVVGGTDEARARRTALAVRQILSEETAGRFAPTVGFAFSGPEDREPDVVLGPALGALEEARGHAEGVAGATGVEVGGRVSGVVESMVGAMEAKDPDIREHLEGVRRLALRIGRGMALPEEQIEVLSVGALLHDVGKIGIPDRILHKPGPLTDGEYETMKRHPVLGAEIVSLSGGLVPALPMVKHHHERFDGNGYPDGLRGEDIPLLARIVSVADAFDSMIRTRPYGYGIPEEIAVREIRDNSGTQFDPRIVAVLVGLAAESERDDRRANSAG